MRALLALALLTLALLAGCSDPAEPAAADDTPAATATSKPEPVDIHDVLNVVQGAQDSWTFEVGPNATTVEMRFYATGKAVAGTGLPTCLTIETPDGADLAGICQGGGVGNVQVAPYVVNGERVFYEHSGLDAAVGTYVFTLDAQPSLTDFHALVTVSYD